MEGKLRWQPGSPYSLSYSLSGAPCNVHHLEPGHFPSEASFTSAGSKAFCPWTGGHSRLLELETWLGSGRKVFSSLTIGRFLFFRMMGSHVVCILPCKRGELSTYSCGCNLYLSVSVPPGADAGRRKERSGNSMSFFQGLVSSLFLAHNLSLSFFLAVVLLVN